MTIITDYIAQTESTQQQDELVARLERRRQIAERGVEQFGSRLAFAAYLARRGHAG